MPLPRTLTQPVGFGEIIETDSQKLYRELHATAVAIYQAKQRNDKQAVIVLRDHFQEVADAFRAAGGSDMTAVDNFILATGTWIESSVDAIPSALAALPAAVGGGLIRGAIPYALLFAGYVLLRNWGRK